MTAAATSLKAHVTRASIAGVRVVEHVSHDDHRGTFTEVFREEWDTGIAPLQWNIVRSQPDVYRGLHVHVRHADYIMVVQGTMILQMRDMRRSSPTYAQVEKLELHAERMRAVCVPPGVAHGFYFPREAMHLYSVSHYWSLDDELGCRWDDPETGMTWPTTAPKLSKRDVEAGTFRQMHEALDARLNQRTFT